MDSSTFFKKFELSANAPNGVVRMRELVLQLAMQGQLAEQNTSDGEALEIFTDSMPLAGEARYSLPPTWIWIRFSEVGDQRLGKMLDRNGNRGELKPYLRNTNVQWMRFELDDIKELRLQPDELEEYRLAPNDLLICEGGEPGRCAIWKDPDREMFFQKAIHRVRPRKGILPDYLAVCLQTDARNGVLAQLFTGATIKHLTGRSLRSYSIPLPPLAEQKRIVAKVDELMALCDELEAQQAQREQQTAALHRAALHRFTAEPSPANLSLLFQKDWPVAPADLRKTILTLAVQGKLVPQDPNDESAESKVAARFRLSHSGYSTIPDSWCWSRVEATGDVDLGRQRAPQHHRGPHMRPYLRVQNVYEARIDISDIKEMNFTPDEYSRFALKSGDVLLNEGQSRELVGRPAIYRAEVPGACFQNTLVRYRPFEFVTSEYALVVFRAYMRSGRFREISKQTTNIAHLSAGRFAKLEFPLPPVAEQRRIVAKVDQLMALVDLLEAQLDQSRTAAQHLLDALVAHLTAA